jgi:hypothetical protein
MKDFTLNQEALELKQLGFDEAISTYYSFPDNELSYVMDGHSKVSVRRNSQFGYAVSAPTYSQAFRFFRKKYGLNGISPSRIYKTDFYQSRIIDWNTWNEIDVIQCSSYEEAELACLKKLIEIVKQKQQ